MTAPETDPASDRPDAPGRVVVFAPAPLLTITIEAGPENGEVHLHAGGQGVWQARMVAALGVPVTLCATFGGETGRVARALLEDEGFDLVAVERADDAAAYVHDRRDGERTTLVETDDPPLSRHELDELYAVTLREAMESAVVLLSGPAGDEVLPAETYRRLASDLRSLDCLVMADLAGERLTQALAGGIDVVKVSHEELLGDGRIDDDTEAHIVEAMHQLRREGAASVVVSRASKGMLTLIGDVPRRVRAPDMQVVDTKGAGDSLTAAIAATLARGETLERAVVVGAAAGALNVTRHGLGTGDAGAILKLSERVTVTELASPVSSGKHEFVESSVTPDELVGFVEEG